MMPVRFSAPLPTKPKRFYQNAQITLSHLIYLTLLLAIIAPAASAQKLKTLVSFDKTNGSGPNSLILAKDGDFYGVTSDGGANGDYGTVFSLTKKGKLTTIYSFCKLTKCSDGLAPVGVTQGTDGNFYGTTLAGGKHVEDGTVFKLTSSGELSTLYNFCSLKNCADGANPYAGLVQASNGDFYGTTAAGGAHNDGTVFQITPSGVLTTIYNFCSQDDCADGSTPRAPLIQASDGNLYGSTYMGGVSSGSTEPGTLFRITTAGVLTTLYTFCSETNCIDGVEPLTPLVQGPNDLLYGSTPLSNIYGGGTIFSLSLDGAFHVLYTFCSGTSCPNGNFPDGGLVPGTNGNLYGTAESGGTSSACSDGCGTIFEVTPDGNLTTQISFDSTDGNLPQGAMVLSKGTFYGTTATGGANDDGTVFSFIP
jgi:uncharacterized repeat protein (TIGR03803 family)